jgi:hypothetical protein
MPEMEPWKQAHVALAGFAAEFASLLPCLLAFPDIWPWYPAAVLAHFALYPFYAGEDNNDFRWV